MKYNNAQESNSIFMMSFTPQRTIHSSIENPLLTVDKRDPIPTLPTLVSKLKSLYANPTSPFIAQECLKTTIFILLHNPSPKRIDIRDIILNNLALAWNIHHEALLTKFISLVSCMVKGGTVNQYINCLQQDSELPCIDVFPIRDLKMQRLVEKAILLSCRVCREERIFHHYLRQAKAAAQPHLYQEALLCYLLFLCQGQVTPNLSVNALIIDGMEFMSGQQMRPILGAYSNLFQFVDLKEGLREVYFRLCQWSQVHSQKNSLNILVSCILEYQCIQCLSLQSIHQISLSKYSGKTTFLMKCISIVNEFQKNICEKEVCQMEIAIKQYIICFEECDFLILELINALQRIKNKWQGNKKWIFIARIQMYLLLYSKNIKSFKVDMMAYMPSNIQIIFISQWTQYKSVQKINLKQRVKSLEQDETIDSQESQTERIRQKKSINNQEQQDQIIKMIGLSFNCHQKNIDIWIQIVTKLFAQLKGSFAKIAEKWLIVILDYTNISQFYVKKMCLHITSCLSSLIQNVQFKNNTLACIIFQKLIFKIKTITTEVLILFGLTLLLYARTIFYKKNSTTLPLQRRNSNIRSQIHSFIKNNKQNIIFFIEPLEKELLNLQSPFFQSVLDWYAQIHIGVSINEILSFISCLFWLKANAKESYFDMISFQEERILGTNMNDYIKSLKNTQTNISILVSIWVKQLFLLVNKKEINPPQQFNFDREMEESAAILLKIKKYLSRLQISQEMFFVHGISLYKVSCLSLNAILSVQCLIDLAFKTDLLQIKDNLIRLQLSLIYAFSPKPQTMQYLHLQLIKHVFLQRISHPFIFGQIQLNSQQRKVSLFRHLFSSIEYKGDDDESQAKLIQSKYFKALYLISQGCFPSKRKAIMSYFASYIWSRGNALTESIVERRNILLLSTQKSLKQQSQKQQSLLESIVGMEYNIDQFLIVLMRKQIKYCLGSNTLSLLKSFLSFSAALLIRCGFLLDINILYRVYMRKDQEIFHILPIVDSFKNIMQEEIDHHSFAKIQQILVKNRKSLVSGLTISKISQLLKKSLNKCKNYGKVLAQILLLYFESQFSFKKHQIFMQKRLIFHSLNANLNKNIPQKIQTNKKVYSRLRKIEQRNMEQQCNQYSRRLIASQKIEQQMENMINFKGNTDEIILHIKYIIKWLSIHVYTHYQEAIIIKSYLGSLFDIFFSNPYPSLCHILDSFLIQLFLIFQDQTYQLKTNEFSLPQLHLYSSFPQLLTAVSKHNFQRNHFLQSQYSQLKQKFQFLSRYNKNPLSLIFPLGCFLYNIGVCGRVFVTKVPLDCFADYACTVRTLIARNRVIICRKNVSQSEWWASRERTNRQMGKILVMVDAGVFDAPCSSFQENDYLVDGLTQIDPALIKFVGSQLRHLQEYIQRLGYHKGQIIDNITAISHFGGLSEMVYNKDRSKTSIMLCIAQDFMSFPFEGCPQLQRYEGIYRIPSIRYLMQHREKNQFDLSRVRFLANSQNDLPETEAMLLKIKQFYPQWEGVIGRRPTLPQFTKLVSGEMYLYMGHGTGTSHFSEQELSKVEMRSLAMLFGCSSANMGQQNCEAHGAAYNMLLRGCPSLLGCLWDVTDKDIDKLTEQLFKERGRANFSSLVERCKMRCKLTYLNGSAVVIFGVPAYLHCK